MTHPDASAETHPPVDAHVEVPVADPTTTAPPAPVRWFRRDIPKRWIRPLLVGAALLGATVFALAMSSASGYAESVPGPVVKISGFVTGNRVVDTIPTTGWFAFTTVRIQELSHIELLQRRLRGVEVARLTRTEVGTPALVQMRAAKELAAAVAVWYTHGTPLAASGALVLNVRPGSPADKAGIVAGDTIVAVDAVATATPDALAAAIGAATGSIEVTVVDATERVVNIAPIDGRIGVEVTTALLANEAAELDVDTDGVGGPSGGLLLTLAFIDALSPGDLTAGQHIAGTGTIAPDGSVGMVAGIDLKLRAAAAAGAEVFLHPRGFVPSQPPPSSITLVEVDSLATAVAVLCAAGATDAVCDGRS